MEGYQFFQNEFNDDMGELLMGHTEVHQGIDMCSPDNSSDDNLRKNRHRIENVVKWKKEVEDRIKL